MDSAPAWTGLSTSALHPRTLLIWLLLFTLSFPYFLATIDSAFFCAVLNCPCLCSVRGTRHSSLSQCILRGAQPLPEHHLPLALTGRRSQVLAESLSLPPSLPLSQAPETATFSWKCSPLYMRIHLRIFFTWDASFLLVANLPYTISCTSDLFCSYLPLNCILLCKSLLVYLHSQCPRTGNEKFLLVFCLLSYKQNHN